MGIQLLTIMLGLFVGLSLGALGGGGSTLAVPVLVFVAGLDPQAATTASLIVVGVAAAIGVTGHYLNGNVRLRSGITFGAAGIVGAQFGTLLNQSLPEQLLLIAFSALIAVVSLRMYRSVRSPISGEAVREELRELPISQQGPMTLVSLAKLGVAATAVGILTGLFGVGGGFAVVPALTLLLGFNAKEAVGTSLVVIAINAAVALTIRAGDIAIEWGLVGPFLVTVTLGVLVGSQVSNRIDSDRLTRTFAVLLGLVATYTALNAISL